MKKNLKGIIIGLIIVLPFWLWVGSEAFGATYYVDNSGCGACADYRVAERDCGSGGETNYATLQAAADAVSGAGDIVNIRTGTYSGEHDGEYCIVWNTNSGSSPNYITFQAYNGEVVVIDNSSANTKVPGALMNVEWIKFKDLKFDETGTASQAFRLKGYNVHNEIYFDNCEFEGGLYGAAQLTFSGSATANMTNIDFVDCSFHDSAGEGFYASGDGDDTYHVDYVRLENCEFYNNDEAIQFTSDSVDPAATNIIIRGNKIYNNSDTTAGGWAIINLGRVETGLVAYNHIYDNTYTGGVVGGIDVSRGQDISIIGNVMHDNSGDTAHAAQILFRNAPTGCVVYNNTIHNHNATGIYAETGIAVTVINNIISGCAEDAMTGDTITESYNNCYDNNDDCAGVGDITTDPKYVNSAGDDFTLKPGSPARHGAAYLVGYESKLKWTSTWPDGVLLMDDILSIGAYAVPRGAAGM